MLSLAVHGSSPAAILTHDHDVNVGQDTAVSVGGFTLVDSTVLCSGVKEHQSVIKYLLVVAPKVI